MEWLQAQDPDWLAHITHVSMDTSATYARAARLALPNAVVVVDPFHLVSAPPLLRPAGFGRLAG